MKKFSEYLTEAVEQLDEISKEKLSQYIIRSAHDKADKTMKAGRDRDEAGRMYNDAKKYKNSELGNLRNIGAKSRSRSADRLTNKMLKRTEGISKAVDKLAGKSKVPARD